MKKFKKIASLLLALVMVLAMSTTAFAASITVDGVEGQTYTAYKVFDVTSSDGGFDDNGDPITNYAYTITDDESAWFDYIAAYATETSGLTLTQITTTTVYNVTVTSAFNAASFAEYLNNYTGPKPAAAGSTTIAENAETGTIEGLAAGYYFLDSSLGALCILNTTADTVTVKEKNAEPTIGKTVSKVDSVTITGEDGKSVTASIGDEVEFTLTLTAGGAADTSYVVHDVMSDGLTLNTASFKIQVSGEDVISSNYTITTSGLTDRCTFEIAFDQTYTATLAKDTVITITYTATVDDDIVPGEAEKNSVNLTYGGTTTSTTTEVEVYTYSFDLVKTTTSDTVLSGAKFQLKDGTEILGFVKSTNSDGGIIYTVSTETSATGYTTTIEAGYVTIVGLKNGSYTLIETEAPAGYNALADGVTVTIKDANNKATVTTEDGVSTYVSGGVEVENKAGAVLPGTGGIGTTIFYVVGTVMVLGAVVVLITRKRMSAQ